MINIFRMSVAAMACGLILGASGYALGHSTGYREGYAAKPMAVPIQQANAPPQQAQQGPLGYVQAPQANGQDSQAFQGPQVIHHHDSGNVMAQAMVGTMLGNAMSRPTTHHVTTVTERRPLVIRRDVPTLPAAQALNPTITPRAPAPVPSAKRLTATAPVVSTEERTIQRRIQAQDGLTRTQAGAATSDLRSAGLVAPVRNATISNTVRSAPASSTFRAAAPSSSSSWFSSPSRSSSSSSWFSRSSSSGSSWSSRSSSGRR